jgi:hypothetical protein
MNPAQHTLCATFFFAFFFFTRARKRSRGCSPHEREARRHARVQYFNVYYDRAFCIPETLYLQPFLSFVFVGRGNNKNNKGKEQITTRGVWFFCLSFCK